MPISPEDLATELAEAFEAAVSHRALERVSQYLCGKYILIPKSEADDGENLSDPTGGGA